MWTEFIMNGQRKNVEKLFTSLKIVGGNDNARERAIAKKPMGKLVMRQR